MKNDFKKLIIGVLVFSVLLVSFSLVYYYVYFLPQKESMQLKYEEEKEIKQLELEMKQIELERQKKEQLEKKAIKARREYLLDQCLNQAHKDHYELWNKTCKGLGKEEDCGLLRSTSERLDRLYKEAREDCFKKYPQD